MLVAASSTPPHPGANSRSSSPICPRTKLMRTLPNTSSRSSPARSPLVWRRGPSAQGYIPKIPLGSIPCLMHLGLARLVGILGRGRCIDDLRLRDDRIDDRASRNPQSVGCEVQLHLLEQRPVPCQDNRWPGREVASRLGGCRHEDVGTGIFGNDCVERARLPDDAVHDHNRAGRDHSGCSETRIGECVCARMMIVSVITLDPSQFGAPQARAGLKTTSGAPLARSNIFLISVTPE